MEKQITDEQLIALLEGQPHAELEAMIERSAALQKRYFELKEVLEAIDSSHTPEVPEHIRAHVQQAIVDEQAGMQRGFTWMHLAAAVALLILGFAFGRLGGSDNTGEELAAMRAEIASLREATLTSSLKRHSASDRLLAVNKIEASQVVNPEMIATLVSTLNTDESPNVRYAAMQALGNYMDNEVVRSELVKSLEFQRDPLIQISLITLMVEAQEKSARAPLHKLIQDEETLPEVKQQAEIALKVLV